MSYLDKRNEIDALQQKIDSYGELSADVKKKINYKFRLDWNYYSNSMEGNTLTMEETRSVMVGNLTVGGKPIKDVLEMKGHDEVIAEILKIGKGEARLSEARIREIHKGIMHEENEVNRKKIGGWKTVPNHVINYKGEKFDFVLPADVPERMHELLNKTNAAIDAIQQKKKPASSADRDAPHPVDVALQFHLDYVLIHPFYDGNGRTARILTNLLLISFGYPPFWVKTNERNIYNQYIADIQGYGGKADLFFDFAAGLILRSQQLILDAIEGKDISEDEDFIKEIRLIKRKTENLGFTKSPKLVYETFMFINEEIWKKLTETLKHFDELFNDTHTSHYVNLFEERYPKTNLIESPFIVSSEPLKSKIFGFDIYETDVNKIEWYHAMFGLRGSKSDNKFEINLSLLFAVNRYTIKLSVNYKTVYEVEKQYNDFLLSEEREIMDKELKMSLLSEIKKSTNVNE